MGRRTYQVGDVSDIRWDLLSRRSGTHSRPVVLDSLYLDRDGPAYGDRRIVHGYALGEIDVPTVLPDGECVREDDAVPAGEL